MTMTMKDPGILSKRKYMVYYMRKVGGFALPGSRRARELYSEGEYTVRGTCFYAGNPIPLVRGSGQAILLANTQKVH